MVTKRRSIICTIFFSAILCCIITLCLGNTFEQVFAKEVISEDTSFSSRIENYEGYGCENGGTLQHNLNGQTVNYSVEHPTGFGCGSACGPGREGGFSSNYINGCRQWQQMPIISPLYKYWIDEETLSPLTEAERQQFIENVDAAAILWNSTQMNDGTGKIITLQKLSSNGADVVPIRYDATLNSLGEFNPVPLFHEIKLKVFTGRTPLHEFGHMLGLQDLDMNNAPADWAHTVLMGYLAGTPLSYQDIQGLAVANSKHTDHLFNRYFVDGGQYEHVCFYCDLIDTQSSAKNNSVALVEAATCLHNFRSLVSATDRNWFKCTECYKVIQSEFNVRTVNNNGNAAIEILGLIDANKRSVTIPSEIGGLDVVSIADGAFSNSLFLTSALFQSSSKIQVIGNYIFKNCSALTNIILPNGIISIGDSSFENCNSLSMISRLANIEMIGANAFKNCSSLTSMDLSSTKVIGDSAFENCRNLTTVSTLSNLQDIGAYAFKGCSSLTNLNIPSSTTSIGEGAFAGCNSLNITVSANNTHYSAQGNILYDNNKTTIIASGLTYIGQGCRKIHY